MAGCRLRRPAGALVLLLLAGCGYSTKRLERFPSARTVAVLPIYNETYRRDLALELTQAVVMELRARTSYAIGSPQTADLLLGGSMNAWEKVVIVSDQDTAIQKRLQGTVRVTVTDRVSGRVLHRETVSDFQEYRPGEYGESLAGSATDEWVRRMAERIVQALEPGF